MTRKRTRSIVPHSRAGRLSRAVSAAAPYARSGLKLAKRVYKKYKSTKRTSRIQAPRQMSAGNSSGPENSYVTLGPKKPNRMLSTVLSTVPPSQFYSNGSYALFGNQGVQSVVDLVQGCFFNGDLNNVYSTGFQNVGNTPGGQTSQSVPISQIVKYTIKNMDNVDAYARIYTCTPRQDVGFGNAPGATFTQGFLDGQGATGMRSFNIGTTPQQSAKFNEAWRILKTTNLKLCPGAEHVHTMKAFGNRVWKAERENFGAYFVKGWSVASFIVFYGGIVDGGGASTVVSTSPGKLTWIYNNALRYKLIAANSSNFNYYTQLPTTGANSTLDQATGTVATEVAA